MVPHLSTALTGPINELEARILDSMPAIERWFRLEWMEHTPPFYCSVDLRNAGFKLAPVDTDLFPGGFNNLSAEMLPLAVQAAMAAVEKICPEAKNLLLIPCQEATGRPRDSSPTSAGALGSPSPVSAHHPSHNSFYLMNLQRLMRIFTQAGLNVRLGSLDAAITAPTTLRLADGAELLIEPLKRSRGRLGLKNFDPCAILLNHDLSAGIPQALKNLHEQYLLPPLHAGWALRRKSNHFKSYEEVAKKFAKLLGMDAWLINPMFGHCGKVDFAQSAGVDCVRTHVDALLTKIRRKHKEYGINERPFAVVKTDNGSRGMGIMSVHDVKQIDDIQRRASSSSSNESNDGSDASDIIIQEGVPTYERVNDAVAEPVVYMIDRYVVGGFYRVHADRGVDQNLNAPGASYVPLAFDQSHRLPKPGEKPGASMPNRFYMYGVIARLAMLAASYELEATDPDAGAYA